MNERLAAWSPLILVALLAGLTFWLDRIVRFPTPGSAADTRRAADFTIDGFSAVAMNPDGSRRYTLSARHMSHYPEDNRSTVEAPQMTYFNPPRAPIVVRADTAEILRGGDEVVFRGDVRLSRDAFDAEPGLGIFTSAMRVLPAQDIATTDKPVRMARGNSTASAVGLEFNNRTQQLKLLSGARISYENPRRKSNRPAAAGRTPP